jgi:hypothetical protein
MFSAAVKRVLERLNDGKVDYVVLGGVAVNLHGVVRSTEDFDIYPRGERGRTSLYQYRLVWACLLR